MGSWLALKISAVDAFQKPLDQSDIVISIPKKILPLATDRNRLRRVIREAIRSDLGVLGKNKRYIFRVMRKPPKANLAAAKEALKFLEI